MSHLMVPCNTHIKKKNRILDPQISQPIAFH